MNNNKQYQNFVENIDSIFQEINQENERELQKLIPLVDEVIRQQSQDVLYIESLFEQLFELVLFQTGEDVNTKLLNYLSTFNPSLAKEIEEQNNDLLGKYDHIVEEAKLLAQNIHLGQTDKAGEDYFSGHLTVVGKSGCNWKDKVVGYLHDAAEDTEYSVEEVVNMLQTKCENEITELHLFEIKEALDLLNNKTAKSREEYISRIRNSRIATRVKLNDLRHNMDISRIPNPNIKDMERLKRYKKEYHTILEYLGPVSWDWDDSN